MTLIPSLAIFLKEMTAKAFGVDSGVHVQCGILPSECRLDQFRNRTYPFRMVSTLPEAELTLMRRNLHRRILEKERRLDELYQAAKLDAGTIIRHITEHYHPLRIYQWGSLISGSHFSEMSDIDIGIEGITDPATFYRIMADAEIDRGLQAIGKIEATMQEFQNEVLAISGRTKMTAMIAAQLLENFYTCLETIFLRISQFFENNLPHDAWHAALLERMTLHVSGVRDAAIADETRILLDELRRFRHFKRYYFELEYDWARLDYLLGVYRRALPLVSSDLDSFKSFLKALGSDR